MFRQACVPLFALMFAAALTLAGCDSATKTPTDGTASATPTGAGAVDDHEHAHEHPSVGPHQGDLIELGNEEYHAELVLAESSVTIYILDGHAESAVPIEATEVTMNIPHGDQPEQFKLAASAQDGDPEGKSSRFTSDDSELAGELEHHDDAQLSVSIDGKQYRGQVAHEHDDEQGHDHEHEEDDHEHGEHDHDQHE